MRRRPQLLPDWRTVLRRAWSLRLILLAGLLTGCEAVLSAMGTEWLPVPVWARMAILFGVLGAAFVARLLAQKDDDGQQG
jgi:hypothetical protein